MRIPRFQRSYVWERSKIVKLLNSIYHEFPIGSFFLWEADVEMEGFCRDITEFGFPAKPSGNKFSFILDGQQRITSLYVALKGKKLSGVDYSNICFNLDKKVFKIPTLTTEPNNIPAWKLFNYAEFQSLLIEYASAGEKEKAQTLSECKTFFDSYPVSIIVSKNMNLAEVVTIFERINQGGKRLSLFDLVHASVWSQDFDLRDKISEFNHEKAIQIFGKVDNEIFIQSLVLNISKDCVKRHQLALKNEDCKAVWPRTTECIRLAIDFLKTQLGVQGVEIIPYQNIIPIIQYYFYITNEGAIRPEHKKALVDWFWSLTFSTRYSSSTLTKMKNDAMWIEKLVKDPGVTRVFTVKLLLDDLKRIRMGNRPVIKNGVLCLMALQKPVDFDNGNIVTLDKTNASRQNSKENHHFFPYSLAGKMGVKQEEINSLLNFAFISKHLNLAISNKYPSNYLQGYAAENADLETHLQSHFISPAAYQAALKDDFQAFITARGGEILEAINRVCRVNDDVKTLNSNIDEDEEEIMLDGVQYEEALEDKGPAKVQTGTREILPRHLKRKAFWTEFIKYNEEHDGVFVNISPVIEGWISKSLKTPYGIGITAVVGFEYDRVEIYIGSQDSERNKRIFDFLYDRRAEIESEYGRQLVWERLTGQKGSRIKDERLYKTFEMEDKTEIFEFMNSAAQKMFPLFRKYILEYNEA